MKKIIAISALSIFLVGLVSCEKETDLYQSIKTEDAYKTVLDVDNGINGAYYALGSYRLLGMNVPALGDMATDVSKADASSGHFVTINKYTANQYSGELNEIWLYGYKVIDRCVRATNGAELLLETTTNEDDMATLYKSLSQAYSLRALTNFYLVNIFGLPYQPGVQNTQKGIILLENAPIEPFATVSRSSVEATYAQILSQIQKAKDYYTLYDNAGGKSLSAFYMGEGAIYALEARVKLYMHDWNGALIAAQTAIDIKGPKAVSNDIYQTMWRSIAITDEDIFTIAKSDNDNLSANSLNTLYGSYKGQISAFTKSLLDATDIRKALIATFTSANQPAKFQGTSTSQATSNIPIFRVSEMYLIIAEGTAQLNVDLDAAKDALLFTAQRNTAITTTADLPATQADLLTFIAKENVREFFAEGHRWFDLRRTGNTFLFGGKVFDVAKFVFPIPDAEVASGAGVEQNDNWFVAIPK
ncbi:RagB/SusD family nutrient uptake outer membrane protein [Williamwhitmania taraxaci]|nr:RagB/SusD family nutrient uptake outer membrane protein [Williamwhitmania taraxaci]